MVKVSPLKGILVKPVGLKDPFKGQASWAIGESSKGSSRKLTGSSVPAAVPASMMEVFESLVTAALPASASVGSSLGFSGVVVIDPRKFTRLLVTAAVLASIREVSGSPVTAATPASASVGSFLGFSDAVVIDRRMGDVTQTPITGYSSAGATHNSFSPLSGLGCREDLCFGEKDDLLVAPGAKRGDCSSLVVEPVLPSQAGGFELLQDGPEHLLSQWKHRVVNPSGFFHGEEEDGFLECSPLSKWDPNGQKELKVIQESDKGDFQGSGVVNSNWVCSLMNNFCTIIGFPIVKHRINAWLCFIFSNKTVLRLSVLGLLMVM